MSHTLQHSCTGTPSPPFSVQRSEEHCHDPRSFSVALLRNHHVTGWRPGEHALHRRRSDHWTRGVVSSLCPTTSRFYFQPMAQRKASRRHRNRTSMTNKFILCWLHHSIYRSEKQVRNDHKFITPHEKAWSVHLKIRQSEVQGNLSQCFQVRVGWIKTHFPIETKLPENINRFLGVMNRFSDSLIWQTLRDLSLLETESTCMLKRELNSWGRNSKCNLFTHVIMSFSRKLKLSDWHWRTPIMESYNLEESKFDCKKN